MTAFYFGTYRQAGHYLWDEYMQHAEHDGYKALPYRDGRERPWGLLPWKQIDGAFNPSAREGEAAVAHKDGWTALGFANYTDDKRGGSNSAFFFDQILDFDAALTLARETFPSVFEHLDFGIARADA